jgi:lipopolysaccharide export system protein LptA
MAQYIVGLILSTLSGWALALPEDRDQPIEINADTAVINEKENRARYEGAVVVTQGTLKLNGDLVDLSTNESGEVDSFIATGAPARFENLRRETDAEPVRGRAAQIEYSYDTDLVVLTGDAEITTEDSVFAGPEITYALESGEVVASGSRSDRVNMTMQPKRQ